MNDLITIQPNKALALFTDGEKLDHFLQEIKGKALSYDADLSTAASRREIASVARKVSTSKTMIDSAGKELVKDWKDKAKKVDLSRKKSREFLDNLRDEVRKPLTDWEISEKERIAKEELKKEIDKAWEEAIAEQDLFLRKQAIEEKEAQFAKEEAERVAVAQKIKEENEALARDERLKQEAAKKAKKEAEEKAANERIEADRKLQEERELREKAEHDRIAAEERAKVEKEIIIKDAEEKKRKAEHDRIIAEENAKVEKELAVKKAKEEAERVASEEKEEAERIEKDRIAAEKLKAADKSHRKEVNNKILTSFVDNGISDETAKKIIILVATNKIPKMFIGY